MPHVIASIVPTSVPTSRPTTRRHHANHAKKRFRPFLDTGQDAQAFVPPKPPPLLAVEGFKSRIRSGEVGSNEVTSEWGEAYSETEERGNTMVSEPAFTTLEEAPIGETAGAEVGSEATRDNLNEVPVAASKIDDRETDSGSDDDASTGHGGSVETIEEVLTVSVYFDAVAVLGPPPRYRA
jgi:hypothetical protein